ALPTYVVLADVSVAWWYHHSPDIALRMVAISAQSFAFTAFATELIKKTTGRERPSARSCEENSTESQCTSSSRNLSFPSGHTSVAFTAAGLACAFHQDLPLYDTPSGDRAMCIASMGIATLIGFLRVVADEHHLTDVIAGGALGTLSGYVLPHFL